MYNLIITHPHINPIKANSAIEVVEKDSAMGSIITELPKEFALSKGESIQVFEEEILYKAEPK